jgi:hypothetical protein
MVNVYQVIRIAEDEDGPYHDVVGVFATPELATVGIKASVMRLRTVGIETMPDAYHTKEFTVKETPLQAQVINEMDNICITCQPEENEE